MEAFGAFLGALVVTVITLFLFSWVVQITYNNSIVVMSQQARPISYWQSMAFVVLVAVLGTVFIGARGFSVPSRLM